MPLKSLVVIALRLYAIYWLVNGLSALLVYLLPLLGLLMSKDFPASGMRVLYSLILIPPSMLAFACILWFISSQLSLAVTKGHDTQLTFTSLTREDFYHFAFIFLGLFFILSSIYSIVQTGYQFFASDFPQPESNPHKGAFFGHALTLIAGLACILGARKWTNKLIRLENRQEASRPVA